MDISALEDIGLTKGQIKVYLSLLELGSSKAGVIIEKSGLQSSVVHNCLHSLLDRGLLSYVKKGKIRVYMASDPKHIIDFIDDKKKNFEKILPQLLVKRKLSDEKNEAEVYEGSKGVMVMLLETIEDAEKGDEWLFFAGDIEPYNKEIQDFFKRFDPKRKGKGMLIRGIAPLRLEHLFEDRVRKGFMEMKYNTTPSPPKMSVCNDKVAFFTWGEKPLGYLIHSKQLAEKYKEFFESVWRSI
tara:strand:- start:1348 stop:2070 length:723 start_codon:yes stop_codon:yes gene_type:complete